MRIPGPAIAIAAMLSVQTGAALTTNLFDALGPAGSSWIRVLFSAIILLIIARPSLRGVPRHTVIGTILLGALTGLMMLMFIESIARIPLGTASAIEFLGPLTVSAVRSRRLIALVWPALALAGVVALTQPWAGHINLEGVAFALGAAVGWAGYIVLTQRVGEQLSGFKGLSLSLTVAALVMAPFGAPGAIRGLTPLNALEGLGLAVLVPLLAFALELTALRRMRVAAFGTLMAVEPAIATLLGLILLAQAPNILEVAGVTLVVVAGIGAQRANPRSAGPEPTVPFATS